ncbi:MAG: hypothetical protein QXX41_00325 [Nitrososphaerota archaeon]
MEDVVRYCRDKLFNDFYEWLEKNKDAVGERWYTFLFNEGKRAEDLADNAIGVVGACLWMFNMVTSCGVMAGLGPDKYDLQYLENSRIDEESTRKLLQTMVMCLNLQYLPVEEAKKPIPIISRSKFSLQLYTELRKRELNL